MDVLDKINQEIPESTTDPRDAKIEQLSKTVEELQNLIKKSMIQKEDEEPIEKETKTVKSIKEQATKFKQEKEQAKNKEQLLISNMNEYHSLVNSLKELSNKDEQDYMALIKEKYPELDKEDISNQNKIFKISIIQLDPEITEDILEVLDKSDDTTIDNQFKISYNRVINQKGEAIKEGSNFSKKLIDKGLNLDELSNALKSGDIKAIREARAMIEKNGVKEMLKKEILKYK